MADTFHFKIEVIKRSDGRSPVAKSAYISGEKIRSEYYNDSYDYRNKQGIVDKGILLPDNAPKEYENRKILWNSLEEFEKQKNAQLARDFTIALPKELTDEERKELLLRFVNENFVKEGMIVDYAIHEKSDSLNYHAHVLTTMRPLNPDGTWGAKAKKEYINDENGKPLYTKGGNRKSRKVNLTNWNDKGNAEKWRKNYSDLCNEYLERGGYKKRVDHRSYERQGLDILPEEHMGAANMALERKGIRTVVGDRNREIRKANSVIKDLVSQIKSIRKWLAGFTERLKKAEENYAREKQIQIENKSELFDLWEYLSVYDTVQQRLASELPYWKEQNKNRYDFKRFVTAINYIHEHDLRTVADLQTHIESNKEKYYETSNKLKKVRKEKENIQKCFAYADTISKTSSVYKEWKGKTLFKDKFYREHKKDIDSYMRAADNIEGLSGERRISKDKWSGKLKELDGKRDELNDVLAGLKEEYGKINHIKYSIETVNKEYGIDLAIEIDKAVKRGEKESTIEKLKEYQKQVERDKRRKGKTQEHYKGQGR